MEPGRTASRALGFCWLRLPLRLLRFAVLAAAIPAVLAAGMAAGARADCPAAGTGTRTVVEVADAMTLRASDGAVLRLAGIDVPGVADGGPLAAAAAGLLRRLTAAAPVAIASVDEGTDRYERRHVLAFLADGRSLQEVLLSQGLARARWYPGEENCLASLLPAEREALDARRGLWASPATGVTAADASLLDRRGLYAYAVAQGRVVSVGHGSRMIFLDFGHFYRSDFTVMLRPAVAEAMAAQGLDVDGLAGRMVRVRGVIEESGGPAFRLNDPAEIELIDGNGDGAGR